MVAIISLCGLPPRASWGQEDVDHRARATRDLQAYYRNEGVPKYEAAIRKLASADPREQSAACAYLVSLLAQAQQDEQSGKAPWQATPFWGAGPMNPARALRRGICGDLTRAEPVDAALPVYLWFLDHGDIPSLQERIVALLAKLHTEQVNALLLEFAQRPHPNAVVLAESLSQIASRKLPLPAKALAPLCQHHRASVRTPARLANDKLGFPKAPPFDPTEAVQREPIPSLMRQVSALLLVSAPPDAPFVLITDWRIRVGRLTALLAGCAIAAAVSLVLARRLRRLWKRAITVLLVAISLLCLAAMVWLSWNRADLPFLNSRCGPAAAADVRRFRDPVGTRGWLLEETADEYVVLTPHGERLSFRKDPSADLLGRTVSRRECRTTPIEEEVQRVAGLRKEHDPWFRLSRRGSLTGQFEGHGAGLYEALLGSWLYSSQRYEQAAEILLPALDTFYRDQGLVDLVRNRLGHTYGHWMLAAFAGDRDYDRTLELAKVLTERFQRTAFYEYARDLQVQIPKRRNDFRTLTLPTPAEWARIKETMARCEQIDFLCERMRLLNCFQYSQPGSVELCETQYQEPQGMSFDASWSGSPGGTEVINPPNELISLPLGAADVAVLAPYLREDWYILAVEYWRDFHPSRALLRTRRVFCWIINKAAGTELCKARELESMTQEELAENIRKTIAWAEGQTQR